MPSAATILRPVRYQPVDRAARTLHRWTMNAMSAVSESARAELIRAIAQNSDRTAFIVLFEYYAPRIKAQTMRFGLDASLADDIAQEAMLAIWQRAAQFDPARGSASAWIFTIATHARIDRQRRDKRLTASVALDAEDPALAIPALDETADGARLSQLLKSLPDDQRRLVLLSFYSDMPHAEIATRLGLPLGTVKSRIRLAMSRLRKLLGHKP